VGWAAFVSGGAICSSSVVTKEIAALELARLIEILETMGGLL
jgi:hypothetical protein